MPREDAPPIRAANRRYALRFASVMAAYAVVLAVALVVLRSEVVTGGARYVVAVLPILPVLGVPWAVIGWLRQTDELQRRLVLESLAVGFATGSVLTFGYGFLQLVGAPDVTWLMVWPVYALCWGVAAIVNARRYRLDDE